MKLLGLVSVMSVLCLTACGSAEDVAGESSVETTSTSSTTTPTETTSTSTTPTETSASSATAPPTSTTTTEPVVSRPRIGNCYDTTRKQFRIQRDGSSPIDCTRRHTAETFAAFRVSPSPLRAEIAKVWRDCQPRFQQYVGDSATISKLDLALILPSEAQVGAGQDWIRCDVILKAHYNARVGVPRAGSLHGALSSGVPSQFRGCVRHWPKVLQPVRFTSCKQAHQAQLIPESLFLGPPDAPYPGVTTAQNRSRAFCAGIFQEYVPETQNYYYYYPTRASWQSGSHNTTCWALDTQGDGLPPL